MQSTSRSHPACGEQRPSITHPSWRTHSQRRPAPAQAVPWASMEGGSCAHTPASGVEVTMFADGAACDPGQRNKGGNDDKAPTQAKSTVIQH